MMRTTFKTGIESLEDLKSVLEMADVKTNTSLTGDIRIISRILNSQEEDIVLNSIKASSEQITDNLINVNIHVPNLKNQIGGTPNSVDNTQPDVARMKSISNVIADVLEDYRGYDFFLSLYSPGEVIPDSKGGYYYNIVIRYTFLRKDN